MTMMKALTRVQPMTAATTGTSQCPCHMCRWLVFRCSQGSRDVAHHNGQLNSGGKLLSCLLLLGRRRILECNVWLELQSNSHASDSNVEEAVHSSVRRSRDNSLVVQLTILERLTVNPVRSGTTKLGSLSLSRMYPPTARHAHSPSTVCVDTMAPRVATKLLTC